LKVAIEGVKNQMWTFSDLYMIFDKVLNGKFYSKRIHNRESGKMSFSLGDGRKIIELLSQGIAANLPPLPTTIFKLVC
jgi:hypothetical protein